MDLISTREVGGTEFGEKIRAMSMSLSDPVDPLARLLAFMAARTQHITQVIRPNISKGACVVSDRYNDSTYVYQGIVDNLLPQYLELLSTRALAFLGARPDITVFFRVDAEVAFERGNARANLDNDQYKKSKQQAFVIAEAYDRIISNLSPTQRKNVFVIDGNQNIEEVRKDLRDVARRIYDGYTNPQ